MRLAPSLSLRLEEHVSEPRRQFSPAPREGADRRARAVIASVCRFYNIDRSVLVSKIRSSWITTPRAVAMYLVREETRWSYPWCGRFFGCHHTTILAAHERVARRLRGDDVFAAEVGEVLRSARPDVPGAAPAPTIPGEAVSAGCGGRSSSNGGTP